MRVVLLPGMDGSGQLLAPFAEQLERRGLDTKTLRYPFDQPQSYAQLIEDLVVPALPRGEPFILLGESFSGPIALALAQRQVEGLRGLVLVVTFADPPDSILLSLSKYLPVKWLASAPIPCWAAHKVMLGGLPVRGDQEAMCRVMKLLQPAVLTERIREVRELRLASKTIELPALYIRAADDLVLPASALGGIETLVPHVRVVDVAGPHLVLDTSPEICADHVASFVSSIDG